MPNPSDGLYPSIIPPGALADAFAFLTPTAAIVAVTTIAIGTSVSLRLHAHGRHHRPADTPPSRVDQAQPSPTDDTH